MKLKFGFYRKKARYLKNQQRNNSTLTSSHSSDLASNSTVTNLLEIIQNSKKYYLNPILQTNVEIKNEIEDYSSYYYQREYEEINDAFLLKKCLNCLSNDYSSSSASSTSSTSQLINTIKLDNNSKNCVTCGRNLISFIPPQATTRLAAAAAAADNLGKSAFKQFKIINNIVQSPPPPPPQSYLYYAC